MALQIANPVVVAKIEMLTKRAGLSKTSAVEKAVDLLLAEPLPPPQSGNRDRFAAILAQLDQVPELPEPYEPLEWDEHGLPL